jgi:hypothetical protein
MVLTDGTGQSRVSWQGEGGDSTLCREIKDGLADKGTTEMGHTGRVSGRRRNKGIPDPRE